MWTSHLRRTITTSFRTPFIYSTSSAPATVACFFTSPAINADKNDYPADVAADNGGDDGNVTIKPSPSRFLTTECGGGGDEKVTTARLFTNNGDNKVTTARFLTEPAKNASNKAVTDDGGNKETERMSLEEVKKLMRLVNVSELKMKLGEEGKEVISYGELLKACQGFGVARSVEEAVEFAKVLDDSGVVLLFRDKVYLHPDKVVELVTSSVPLALTPEDDPRREELKRLQERKVEIDRQAHKQVRVILWSGLGIAIMQVGLFFRLTFWEFSWDVMEPIAFFTTATGLVIGYGYFMMTSRDPTYQDLMKRLFMSRQRKLLKKYHFDIVRYKELSDKCRCPSDKKYSSDNLIL